MPERLRGFTTRCYIDPRYLYLYLYLLTYFVIVVVAAAVAMTTAYICSHVIVIIIVVGNSAIGLSLTARQMVTGDNPWRQLPPEITPYESSPRCNLPPTLVY